MKMKYIGRNKRYIPGRGEFKPGDIVERDKTLMEQTSLFEEVKKESKKKEGEK